MKHGRELSGQTVYIDQYIEYNNIERAQRALENILII